MINKRLTADVVAAKRFTPVRLREGYSMDEVDAFLDEVEGTLADQEKELKELQLQVKQGAGAAAALLERPEGAAPDLEPVLAELAAANERVARLERELAEANERANAAPAAPAAPTGPSLSEAAASSTRMLEMAARQHDELVSQAKSESERIIRESREQAAREAEAAAKAREAQLGSLEAEKAQLEKGLEALRTLENTSRSALREHFSKRLQELDTAVVPGTSSPKGLPVPNGQAGPVLPPAPSSTTPQPATVDEPKAEGPVEGPAEAPAEGADGAPGQEEVDEDGVVRPGAYQEFPSFYGGQG